VVPAVAPAEPVVPAVEPAEPVVPAVEPAEPVVPAVEPAEPVVPPRPAEPVVPPLPVPPPPLSSHAANPISNATRPTHPTVERPTIQAALVLFIMSSFSTGG
jgi:nicotinate-nucleotide--dimethylbenzimidazole phosphoribosyltransferase